MTFTHGENECCPRFFHLRNGAVLAVDDPCDVSKLFWLSLYEIERCFLNSLQNQLNCDEGLEEELIRHDVDRAGDFMELIESMVDYLRMRKPQDFHAPESSFRCLLYRQVNYASSLGGLPPEGGDLRVTLPGRDSDPTS